MNGVEKYVNHKTACPNRDLDEAAVKARVSGYRSYGAMQAAYYAENYTSNIKESAEEKRVTAGYMTVRDRLKIREEKSNHAKN